jgi:O-antigen ligase
MLAPMGGKVERYFIPAVIGFAPVVLALVSWAAVQLSPLQAFVLYTALPVVASELFVIVVALRSGMIAWLRDLQIPPLAIAALAAWLVITVATSTFVAPFQSIAMRWTLHWVVHLTFGFAVAHLACREIRIRDTVGCYLAGFLIYCFLFILFVISAWNVRTDWVHELPGAIHIRHVGIYACAMTGMSIGAMARARSRLAWACTIAVATIGFSVGVWTGSRGMVLSTVGAVVVAAILIPAMRRVTVLGAAVLTLAIGIAAVAWLPVPNGNMMGATRQVAATTQHELTTGRLQIWTNVIHAIVRRPVLGYGPGQMPVVAPFGTMGQPHNFVLQILLDWGAAGLVCVLILAYFYVRRVMPVLREEGERYAAPLTGMMSILALSMIDAAMFHVLPVSIFAACAGMVASRPKPDNAPRTTHE